MCGAEGPRDGRRSNAAGSRPARWRRPETGAADGSERRRRAARRRRKRRAPARRQPGRWRFQTPRSCRGRRTGRGELRDFERRNAGPATATLPLPLEVSSASTGRECIAGRRTECDSMGRWSREARRLHVRRGPTNAARPRASEGAQLRFAPFTYARRRGWPHERESAATWRTHGPGAPAFEAAGRTGTHETRAADIPGRTRPIRPVPLASPHLNGLVDFGGG